MTLSEIRSVLAERGLAPNRRLGQNFLHDQNLCAWLAAQAEFAAGERVWEIGPGLGCYTEALLAAGAHVTAIEVDRGFIDWLRERYAGEPRFELVAGDALEEMARCDGAGYLVGNLPYHISTPLIMAAMALAQPPRRMVFMLQWEMARRLCALPRSEDYGAVSVAVQSGYRVEMLRRVAPAVFHPRPDVDSAAVRLTRLADAEGSGASFGAFVRAAFSTPRKQLLNVVARDAVERGRWLEALRRLRLEPDVRAGEIDVSQWRALHQELGSPP
jgi:16S rRNA (adenine1518-N6/adenine1519-N6)-dimethyltransferase